MNINTEYLEFSDKVKSAYVTIVLVFGLMTSLPGFSQEQSQIDNVTIDSILKARNPLNPAVPFVPANKDKEIALFHKLLKNSKKNGHQRGVVNSYASLGNYYGRNLNQSDSAVFYYDKAILSMKRTGFGLHNLSGVYTNKAIVISRSGMEIQCLEFFEKAYEAALDYGQPITVLIAKINLAESNRKLGNYEKGISLASELLEDSPDLRDESRNVLNTIIGVGLVQTKKPKQALGYLKTADSLYQTGMGEEAFLDTRTWMAQAYLDMGEPKKAIDICENLFQKLPNYPHNIQLTNLVLGKALLLDGQTSRAIQVLNKGLTLKGEKESHLAILETLGFFYLAQKKAQMSKPYFTEAIHMRDSIQTSRTKQFSKYSSISYDLLETEYRNENLSHENEVLATKAKEREYILSLLFMSVVVLVLLILGYVLWKKYYSGKKTIISLKANEKKILESHIKLREDELSATMEYLSKSMETLNAITTDLETTIKNKDYKALGSIHRSLREHQASSSATSLLTDRVESQYPRMTAQLLEMFPSFTANDVKHCIMIKLGLSLKETAQLFNITIAAVKSARGRMRKKMDLDPNVSLKQHLSFIAQSA